MCFYDKDAIDNAQSTNEKQQGNLIISNWIFQIKIYFQMLDLNICI